MEREAPDEVDDEHTVGQRRCEIHHLRASEGRVGLPEWWGPQDRPTPHGTPPHLGYSGCTAQLWTAGKGVEILGHTGSGLGLEKWVGGMWLLTVVTSRTFLIR